MRCPHAVTWRKQKLNPPFSRTNPGTCNLSTLRPHSNIKRVPPGITLIKYRAIATKSLQSACHVSEVLWNSVTWPRINQSGEELCNWIELNKSEVLSTQGGGARQWQAREGVRFCLRSEQSKQVIVLYPATWWVTWAQCFMGNSTVDFWKHVPCKIGLQQFLSREDTLKEQ